MAWSRSRSPVMSRWGLVNLRLASTAEKTGSDWAFSTNRGRTRRSESSSEDSSTICTGSDDPCADVLMVWSWLTKARTPGTRDNFAVRPWAISCWLRPRSCGGTKTMLMLPELVWPDDPEEVTAIKDVASGTSFATISDNCLTTPSVYPNVAPSWVEIWTPKALRSSRGAISLGRFWKETIITANDASRMGNATHGRRTARSRNHAYPLVSATKNGSVTRLSHVSRWALSMRLERSEERRV